MSQIYDPAKASFQTQNPSIDLDSDTIKCSIGRTSAYTFSAAHQFKSSVTTVQDCDAALAGKSVSAAGVFDATDPIASAVPSGAAIDFAVIWKDTGNPATSPVITYLDGASVTPNGGSITVQFSNGASKIHAL